MTLEEARLIVVEGIDYAAYKETESSLHDSDKNWLLSCEHYKSGRVVVKPSQWTEGDFEEKMATLLRWANTLNRSLPAFTEAQKLLEDEDSIIGRVIRRSNRNDLPSLEPQEMELPRWVRIPAGLVVGVIAVLCAGASLSFLPLALHGPIRILGVAVVLVLVIGCLWVLAKCFRLLTGRKYKGGLMSPRALRVVSYCVLVLPILGLFTGYYREMRALAIFQAVMYFFGFLGLRAMARRREAATPTEKMDSQR